MVRQNRVDRSGRKKKAKKKTRLARTFKDTKLKRIKCRFIKSYTVCIVCERICKLKHSVCEKQNPANSQPVASAPKSLVGKRRGKKSV